MKNAFYLLALLLIMNACAKSNLDKEKDCFQVIYPIEYLMPDDSVVSITDEKTKDSPIKDWYIQHPDVIEKASLIYPIDVVWNGELTVVETEERMIEIKKSCYTDKDISTIKHSYDAESCGSHGEKSDSDADYDCPYYKANIGDSCSTCNGHQGYLSSDCECVY